MAPEVSLFANVELEPETPSGALPRLELKSPPAVVDSAARESEATAPAFSLMFGAVGSSTLWFKLAFYFVSNFDIDVENIRTMFCFNVVMFKQPEWEPSLKETLWRTDENISLTFVP